jgi:hypothetical protein
MELSSPIRIKNNGFCTVCHKWFTDAERPQLVRFGDDECYIDLHPECIEKGLEMWVLYYKED